ncbi:MAG: hypothetical protein FWD32_00030 [Firmicutes bacterium]|nr:hypothetical protein [Bacillota bacterium]
MKDTKCANCGNSVKIDKDNQTATCAYCGANFEKENEAPKVVINNYYNASAEPKADANAEVKKKKIAPKAVRKKLLITAVVYFIFSICFLLAGIYSETDGLKFLFFGLAYLFALGTFVMLLAAPLNYVMEKKFNKKRLDS